MHLPQLAALLATLGAPTAAPVDGAAVAEVPARNDRTEFEQRLLFSAAGPGAGQQVVGAGILAPYGVPMPLLQLYTVYGVSDMLQLEGELAFSIAGRANGGLRLRVLQQGALSLALRLNAQVYANIEGSGFGGARPGVIVSLGGESLSWTLDVSHFQPLFDFGDTGTASTRHTEIGLAAEMNAVTGANLYLRLCSVVLHDNSTAKLPGGVVPVLQVGGSF